MSRIIKDQTYIAMNHSFSAIRVFGNTLTPTRISLKLFCTPSSKADNFKASTISYQVLTFWMYNTFDDIMLVNPKNELADILIYTCDNRTLYLPQEPDDNTLTRALHCKIQTITQGNLEIGELVLSSEDSGHTERYWSGNDYQLPGIEYIGKPTIHQVPWWQRMSIDTNEMLKEDITEEEVQELREIEDPLVKYQQDLMNGNESGDTDEEAEIIDDIWKSK